MHSFVRFLSSFSSTFFGVRVKRYKRNRLNQPIVRSLCAHSRRMLDWGQRGVSAHFHLVFFSFVCYFHHYLWNKKKRNAWKNFPSASNWWISQLRLRTVKCVTQFEMKRFNRDKRRDVVVFCTDVVGHGFASNTNERTSAEIDEKSTWISRGSNRCQ